MRKSKRPPLGAHWNETNAPKLYQLYRRVETVAVHLETRRKGGWCATRPYIEELRDIAIQLKVLDCQHSRKFGH